MTSNYEAAIDITHLTQQNNIEENRKTAASRIEFMQPSYA